MVLAYRGGVYAADPTTFVDGQWAYAEPTVKESTVIDGKATSTGTNKQVVVGKNAQTSGNEQTAIGYNATVNGTGSVSIGANSAIDWDNDKAWNKGAAKFSVDNVVSFGNSEEGLTRRLINVAAGINDNDAVNVEQLAGYVAYDKKGGEVDKTSVTFNPDGEAATLKNIGDITIKADSHNSDKTEDRSFRKAGLVAGTVINDSKDSWVTGRNIAIGKDANIEFTKDLVVNNNGRGPWNVVAIGDNNLVKDSPNAVVIGGGDYALSEVKNSSNGLLIGTNSKIDNAEQSVAFGANVAVQNTKYGVAVGAGSQVSRGEYNTAVGAKAEVSGANSIAIGANSKNGKKSSVALGNDSEVTADYQVSVGNATLQRKIVNVADGTIAKDSHDAVTGGQLAAAGIIPGKTNNATNYGSTQIAIGDHSVNEAEKGTTIGAYAKVSQGASESVALGANSAVTWADVNQTGTLEQRGVVSVGKTGEFTRRIINVSDGKVAAGSTDAVNGGQLSEVKELADKAGAGFSVAIPQADGSVQQHTYKPGDTITFTSNNDNLLTDIAEDGTIDVRLNDTLHLASVQSTNGKSALNLTDTGLALGYGDHNISIDESGIKVNGHFSVVTGQGTPLDVTADTVTAGGVTLKAGAVTAQTGTIGSVQFNGNGTITNVAAGSKDTDAVNKGQLDKVAGSAQAANDELAKYKAAGITYGTVSEGIIKGISLGQDSAVTANGGVATGFGARVEGEDGTAYGHGAYVTGEKGTALGANSYVSGFGSVALGAGSHATRNNVVEVGGRQISGVAAGTEATDAVNKGQMESYVKNQVTSATENTVKYNEDGSLSAGNAGTGKLDLNTDGSANLTNEAGKGVHVDKDGKTTIDGGLNVTGGFQINGKNVATSDDVADLSGRLGTIDKQIGADKEGNLNLTNKGTTLVDGINKNTESIGSINKVIGATGENGALKLDNGATTIESGINNNYAAIQQNSTAINNLGYSVNKLGGEIDSVGALSAALAGLHPLDYNPADSKYQLAAAFGGYDGSYALALGGFYNVNQDILLSGGVSTILKGERKTAGNVGVTFRVGAGNSAKDLGTPEDLKEANQQLAALKQDNKVLTGENRKLAEKVESQDQKIADLEAKFEELLKKVK